MQATEGRYTVLQATERYELLKGHLRHCAVVNAMVFKILDIFKKLNRGDTYYDNYLSHYKKRGDAFVDYYHLLWTIGAKIKPKAILEIGCRTGISITQLLSAMVLSPPEKVVLCDIFNDGFISPMLVKMNLQYFNIPLDNIQFLKGDSLKIIPEYKKNNPDQQFDYILVDGNHDKDVARKDLENVFKLIKPAGIIVFDDLSEDGCNLIDVWNNFKAAYKDEFFYLENMNGKGVGLAIRKD